MNIHDSVNLVYNKLNRYMYKNTTNALAAQINLESPENVIALLIECEIITDEIIDKLAREYTLDNRESRAKLMKEWLDADHVLWELIRR